MEGGYPERWPRHGCCPACGEGPLVEAFAKYGLSHARCGTCGFVCVDPFPTNEIIAKLYAGAYYSRVRELFERPLLERGGEGTPYSAPRDILAAMVRRVTNEQASGTWLDVGGGLGAFAQFVQKLKPRWQVKLNEFNPQSIGAARELFDFDIVAAEPAALLREGQRFDVISSVAVLEHIPQPLEFLTNYAALLKPGGWLATITPHFSPLNGFVSRGSAPTVAPPYHVSLFNLTALSRLLNRVEGLEVVSVEQAGPAAFELMHHVEFGDCFDITIPTIEHPEPRTIQVKPYDPETAHLLNVLREAEFQDGRLFCQAGRTALSCRLLPEGPRLSGSSCKNCSREEECVMAHPTANADQISIDTANASFWDELCGSSAARAWGITDVSMRIAAPLR